MPANEQEARTDERLVTDFLLGDEGAFGHLVARYLQSVYHIALRYTRNAARAEDVVQETFIKAWRNLRKFDETRNFRAWLFTIAARAALDDVKKKSSAPFSDFRDADGNDVLAETLRDGAPLPDAHAINRELQAALDNATRTLGAHRSELLRLHYREGYSFVEIAAKFKKPLNTVKSWHQRALIALRKVLKS